MEGMEKMTGFMDDLLEVEGRGCERTVGRGDRLWDGKGPVEPAVLIVLQ